jgi:hypothetical protein
MSPSEYNDLSYPQKALSHKLEFDARPKLKPFNQNKPNDPACLPEYAYHATPTSILKGIQESGLLTPDGVRQKLGSSAQGTDPSKDAFISAARTLQGAGAMSGKSSLLRFNPALTDGDWKAYGVAGEIRTMASVRPELLEVRVKNDQDQWEWRSLMDMDL